MNLKLFVVVALACAVALPAAEAASRHHLSAFLRGERAAAKAALDTCVSIGPEDGKKVCTGKSLLDAVLKVANEVLKATPAPEKVTTWPSATPCTGGSSFDVKRAAAPGSPLTAYFGELTTPKDFYALAATSCGGIKAARDAAATSSGSEAEPEGEEDSTPSTSPTTTPTTPSSGSEEKKKVVVVRAVDREPVERYFSIGKYLFVRRCTGRKGNGFVYLWGTTDSTTVPCTKADYPSMYAKAKETLEGTESMQALKNFVRSPGKVTNPHLANAAAAILIAEVARDYPTLFLNYMLIDSATDAELVLSGQCPDVATTCNHKLKTKGGLHPFAFGGAQASFTTGRWPQGSTATRKPALDEFEAGIIMAWAKRTPWPGATAATCGTPASEEDCLKALRPLLVKRIRYTEATPTQTAPSKTKEK